MIVEAGAEIAGAACGFDSAEKTYPAHGIKSPGLDQVHVIGGDGDGRTGLAEETFFDETAKRIFLLRRSVTGLCH
jgi:hypothetical protein